MTLSNSLSPPVSNNKGISKISAGASRCFSTNAARSVAHRGVHDLLECGQLLGIVRAPTQPADRGRACRFEQSQESARQWLRPTRRRALQPTDLGIGVEYGNPRTLEHARDRGLAHADRAGERNPDHSSSIPRSRSAPRSGMSGIPRIVKVVALDPLEQLHSATLQPEHADAYSRPPAIRHRDRSR